ncbi:MarC family protein [Undibacterium sp.]|jgi:multiple antibiotic resistance protein|uniref:MarC family protein n=1 Tax=Undibacterium sp. TaxID=1914977 RepID=UPI002BE9E4E5|nr:MarC family protein [Undibacterium sp.]HTD04761.1 MarC family protein [Undibacterium sp.]
MSVAMIVFAKAMVVIPITLLPILNPIAIAPIFLSMTERMQQGGANKLAKRIALHCFFLLMGAFFIGSYVLDFFGISLPIVQVGGGLVVALAGWGMLSDKGQDQLPSTVAASHEGDWSEDELRRRSFYPISFPLTVGPGAIAASITLGTQLPHKPVDWIITSFASVLGVMLTTLGIYLAYRFAGNLVRFLGDVGATVLLRLSAFILLCIGIEIGWTGLSDLIEQVKFH